MKKYDLRTNQQKVYDMVKRNPTMTKPQMMHHMRGSCAGVGTLSTYFYTFRAVTRRK